MLSCWSKIKYDTKVQASKSSQKVQAYNKEVKDLVVEANVVTRYQCSFSCNKLMQGHKSVAALLLQCQFAECSSYNEHNMQRMLPNGAENFLNREQAHGINKKGFPSKQYK